MYNVPGQRVIDTQIDGKGSRGFTDDQGRQLTSGVYLYQLRAGDFVARHSMLLVR